MIVKLEELEISSRVKVIPWCNDHMKYMSGNNYKRAINLVKTIAKDYKIAYRKQPTDSNKIEIFCEKADRKEVMTEVKQWEF